MRKAAKKIIFLSIIVLLFNASNPHIAKAKVLYHETEPYFLEVGSQYLLIYTRQGYDVDTLVSSKIYARPCYETVTEFKTHGTEEVLITPSNFVINKTSFAIQKSDALFYNGRTMVIFAVERNDTDFTYFFMKYSDDDGKTWSDYVILGNSTVESSDFVWFDSVVINDELAIFYSYETKVIVNIVINSNKVYYDLDTFKNSTEVTSVPVSLGRDFNLYSYEGKIYVVYTQENQVKMSSTIDGSSFSSGVSVPAPFQLDLENANLTEVVAQDVGLLYPSITRWNDGFFVVAQDISNTTDKQVKFYEMFLWGFWIEDITKQDTLQLHNITSPTHDGYYERVSSVTTFKDNVVVSTERGPSLKSASRVPEISFLFSKDGVKWTTAYFGDYTFFNNPAIYYFVGTLALFVVVFVGNFIFSKIKKNKK